MIKLHDVESGALVGTIIEEHLKVLVEQLEEESPEDRDYYIDADTIEMFEEAGVDAALVDVDVERVRERERRLTALAEVAVDQIGERPVRRRIDAVRQHREERPRDAR